MNGHALKLAETSHAKWFLRTVCVALSLVGATAGCKSSSDKHESAAPAAVTASSDTVKISVSDEGFKPSAIRVRQSQPLTLVFTRTSEQTCATQVSFPELNLTKDLPLNTPVSIQVPTATARTLTFQCGMGMYKSSVVISES